MVIHFSWKKLGWICALNTFGAELGVKRASYIFILSAQVDVDIAMHLMLFTRQHFVRGGLVR